MTLSFTTDFHKNRGLNLWQDFTQLVQKKQVDKRIQPRI